MTFAVAVPQPGTIRLLDGGLPPFTVAKSVDKPFPIATRRDHRGLVAIAMLPAVQAVFDLWGANCYSRAPMLS